MALMTMIARVVDGLPLVGTMTEDEQVGKTSDISEMTKYFNALSKISVRKEHIGVSKSSKNAISKTWPPISAKMFY